MKIIFRILLSFIFFIPVTLFAQSDCPDAIVVCGDSDYSGLDATGIGFQELGPNACSSQEHNSIWLKILIKDGGTLGFTLTPEEIDDLVVDFDFWIFGPEAECDNLGTAIRCSTTNPLAAGLDYNTTGMNGTETDVSEGPNGNGNSFIEWIDVEDDDIYFLIIDRPHGASNFSIEWTGTATFHDIPVFNNPDNIPLDLLDIVQCDDIYSTDYTTEIDLTIYEEMFISTQTDVEITYHENVNDMTLGINPFTTPESFINTSNPQTIYMRMTNPVTGCYDVEMFTIEVTSGSIDAVDIEMCDTDGNGIATFDLSVNDDVISDGDTDVTVTYYSSLEDATNEIGAVGPLFQNQVPYQGQQIWVRTDSLISGCAGFATFYITPIPSPQINTPGNVPPDIILCSNDGSGTFDLTINEAAMAGTQPNLTFEYYVSEQALENDNTITTPETYTVNNLPQTIHIKITNTQVGCATTAAFIIDATTITAGEPEDLLLCDTSEDGVQVFNLAENDDTIINSQPYTDVTYYATNEDALNGDDAVGPLYENVNPYTSQTIWARVEVEGNEDCYDIASFTIDVTPLPVANNPQNVILDLSQCDSDANDDGSAVFNLTVHEDMLAGNQDNITFLYYASQADFNNNIAVNTPEAYLNTANPQTIFAVLHNTATGCYSPPLSFTLQIINPVTVGTPENLLLCDTDENGLQAFDLSINDWAIANGSNNVYVTYYTTQEDAENKTNEIFTTYQNQEPYTTQTIWARVENISGCYGYALTSFTIGILPLPEINVSVDVDDFTTNDNSIIVTVNSPENFEFSLDGTYYTDTSDFYGLAPGLYTIYIRSKDGCGIAEEEVALLNYPKFFTPNGDGVNETWNVFYIYSFPDARVTIFDRYGKLIKSYWGKDQGWDGTFNGENLPSTDYWFVLQFDNGRKISGHFSMIR